MNAERPGLDAIAIRTGGGRFDRIRQSSQCSASVIQRGGDGGRKISSHAVGGQKLAQARQFGGRGPHQIQPSSAVHMDIEESGHQSGIAKVY
jgi:hypothetical protein